MEDLLQELILEVQTGELTIKQIVSRLKLLLQVIEEPIVEQRCLRCDKVFRSTPSTNFCSKSCELGMVPLPYQTRFEQSAAYARAERGRL